MVPDIRKAMLTDLHEDVYKHGFYIRKSSLQSGAKGVIPFIPHRHSTHELLWVQEGRGSYRIDHIVQDFQPGTLLNIPAGQVHLISEDVQFTGYLIQFHDSFLPARPVSHSAFSLDASLSFAYFCPIGYRKIDYLFEEMYHEFHASQEGFVEIIRSYLKAVMVLADRSRSKHALDNGSACEEVSLVDAFYRVLDQNFAKGYGVSEYADMLNVTPRKLTATVSGRLGKTANQIIQDRILLEAQRMLTFTEMTVKEIAFALGFEDPSYFCRVFRKMLNTSPAEWREKNSSREGAIL